MALIPHDVATRLLEVENVDRLTPGMVEVRFGGEQFDGSEHAAPADHVTMFGPGPGKAIRCHLRAVGMNRDWVEVDGSRRRVVDLGQDDEDGDA